MKPLRTSIVIAIAAFVAAGSAQAETLKASHQWPGGRGDVRDEMVQILAKEVANADVGLEIKVYAAKSLYKPKEQWGAPHQGDTRHFGVPAGLCLRSASGVLPPR